MGVFKNLSDTLNNTANKPKLTRLQRRLQFLPNPKVLSSSTETPTIPIVHRISDYTYKPCYILKDFYLVVFRALCGVQIIIEEPLIISDIYMTSPKFAKYNLNCKVSEITCKDCLKIFT